MLTHGHIPIKLVWDKDFHVWECQIACTAPITVRKFLGSVENFILLRHQQLGLKKQIIKTHLEVSKVLYICIYCMSKARIVFVFKYNYV